MIRRPSRRIHDVSPRQGLDRVLLLTAFAAGAGGGVLLKIGGVHPFAAAGFSAAILAGYVLLTWSLTSLRLEPDTIGDNCYYLGFLFTLTSLAFTLYGVVQAGPLERAAIIPEVISGFGVALVSTIVGVFLRVFMMQVRVDIVAREKESRLELNRDVRQFRTDLAQSLRQVKAFTVEALQHGREREEAMGREIDAVARACAEQMAGFAETVDKAVARAAGEATSEAIKGIRDLTEAAAKEVLEGVRKGAVEIDERARALVAEREAVLAEAEAIRSQLRTFAVELVDELRQATEGIRAASLADTEAMVAAQASLSASTKAATRARKLLTSRIEELTSFVERFEEVSSRHSAALAGAMETHLSAQSVIAEMTGRLDEATTQASKGANRSISVLVDAVERFEEVSKKQGAVLARTAENNMSAQTVIAEMTSRLDAATAQASDAARRSVSGLVGAVEHLSGNLNLIERSLQRSESRILELNNRVSLQDGDGAVRRPDADMQNADGFMSAAPGVGVVASTA